MLLTLGLLVKGYFMVTRHHQVPRALKLPEVRVVTVQGHSGRTHFRIHQILTRKFHGRTDASIS